MSWCRNQDVASQMWGNITFSLENSNGQKWIWHTGKCLVFWVLLLLLPSFQVHCPGGCSVYEFDVRRVYFEELENKTYSKCSWTSKMVFLYSLSRTLQYFNLSVTKSLFQVLSWHGSLLNMSCSFVILIPRLFFSNQAQVISPLTPSPPFLGALSRWLLSRSLHGDN